MNRCLEPRLSYLKNETTMRTQILTFCLLGPMLGLQAQAPVDIGAFQTPQNTMEVRIRPTGIESGILSAIVFTLRWETATGTAPGAIQQDGPISTLIAIQPSGPVHVEGAYSYQIYAGFGMVPLSELDMQLAPGEELVIAHIPVPGIAGVELINNDWTGQQEHNGNYYISIGGENRTGSIYGISTSVSGTGSGPDLSVLPNPTTGPFEIRFKDTEQGTCTIRLTNAMGEQMISDVIQIGPGNYRHRMDLRGHAAGLYHVEVSYGLQVTTRRVVLQ